MKELIIALVLAAAAGYLLGSVNTAILVSRLLKHDDIRKYGSGNAGVTNMYRVYGKLPALLTVLGDFLKAALAVVVSRLVFHVLGVELSYDPGYLAGLFVLLGHIFPVYFAFKGGKGVMPLIGVLTVVNPLLLAILAALTLPAVLLTRKMSLGSVIGSVVMPVAGGVLAGVQGENTLAITLYLVAYAVLILVSHRGNIKRLLAGTENPLSTRSPKSK